MFPAQNLRSPPASALLGGSGSIPPPPLKYYFSSNIICLSVSCHLLHHNNQTCICVFYGYTEPLVIDGSNSYFAQEFRP